MAVNPEVSHLQLVSQLVVAVDLCVGAVLRATGSLEAQRAAGAVAEARRQLGVLADALEDEAAAEDTAIEADAAGDGAAVA